MRLPGSDQQARLPVDDGRLLVLRGALSEVPIPTEVISNYARRDERPDAAADATACTYRSRLMRSVVHTDRSYQVAVGDFGAVCRVTYSLSMLSAQVSEKLPEIFANFVSGHGGNRGVASSLERIHDRCSGYFVIFNYTTARTTATRPCDSH